MSSSIKDKAFPDIGKDDLDDLDLQDCFKDSSQKSTKLDEANGVDLDAVCNSMLRSLTSSPSGFLEDRVLLDSLPLARKLLIESIVEMENTLIRESSSPSISSQDAGSRLKIWQSSLEPWHEFLKNLKNLGTVSSDSIQSFLDSLPGIIQVIFSHCKRSESLYGPKFDDLLPQLTSLFRKTNIVLDEFFSILESTVKFDVKSNSENTLQTVLEKVGDIAVLTNGMDLKTLLQTWKAFAKLASVHESLLKKLQSTESVTRRYVDIGTDVETLLFQSLEEKKDTSCERTIKCAGLLLKILGRLCTLYRGYCGNKVSIVLVQLLTKLYRYSALFPSERFIHLHSKITECSESHVVPATANLLNTLLDESEFLKAFFRYSKTEKGEAICYHLLTLRIIEELIKRQASDFSIWLKEDGNIIDVALANINDCCTEILVDKLRVPVFGDKIHRLGLYEMTLQLLSQFVAGALAEDFAAIEAAMLKHLLSGEFWSSLLSCDLWTHVGKIASPELCYEHLSFFIKVQKVLVPREKSFEFEILNNLIARLYKLLPDNLKESLFHELDDYSNRCRVDPFRESLTPRTQQFFWQNSTVDTTNNLSQIFQDLHRFPSVTNLSRLTSLLRSIGALSMPKDDRLCIVTLRDIWSFVASSISKSDAMTSEILFELIVLLLDCTKLHWADNADHLIASIYKSMLEALDHVPVQLKIRMNVFLRDNSESCVNESGKQTLASMTELFCRLVNDDNPWVRQECFETYAEYILKGPSTQLFDSLSVGISQLPRICKQMPSYFSNKQIYSFNHYSSVDNYLCDLATACKARLTWHVCYEHDYRKRDEKMPRLEIGELDRRVDNICNEIRDIIKKKNELSDSSMEKLRTVFLQLLESGV